MTATTDTPATAHPRESRGAVDRSASKSAELNGAVAGFIAGLQAMALARNSGAAARLARLRRGVTRTPGTVPDIWEDTIGVVPERLRGRNDAPSEAENATHAAITLWALHQQSKSEPMHRHERFRGRDLGAAVRDLRRARHADGTDIDPVLRRFQALATATTYAETLQHLRGLVTLLRDAGITADYGQLAADLYLLQAPDGAATVRLRWARSLHSAGRDTTATETGPAHATAPPAASDIDVPTTNGAPV